MIRFECDYAEGCHPLILKALTETNYEQTPGYGEDHHCQEARTAILAACQCDTAEVHFLVGGTQANTTVIAAILRPYQGVLCADTGHINCHETGAIEATGHRVMALPSVDAKITAHQIEEAVKHHFEDASFEHTVQPGMVYLSSPTESGTLYSKSELTAISKTCRRLGLPLFLDGARLGYGLASPKNDLTLADYARLCDVFYIGGTKVGALFGEAVVIGNPALAEDFRYLIKQHGAMLAKGRLLGIQFDVLMQDNLYFDIAAQAVAKADQIRQVLDRAGVSYLVPGTTNQIFPILSDEVLAALSRDFVFTEQQRVDEGHRAVRFCTSWATRQDQVDALCRRLEQLL